MDWRASAFDHRDAPVIYLSVELLRIVAAAVLMCGGAWALVEAVQRLVQWADDEDTPAGSMDEFHAREIMKETLRRVR